MEKQKTKECDHNFTNIRDRIYQIIDTKPFDYRDPCGANNCECYNNSVKIDAIIKALSEISRL